MSPPEFIVAIRNQVQDASASGLLKQLQTPSGRRPVEQLQRLSVWFNNLSAQDKAAVAEIVQMASHHAVFGFLCVIDGVRAIEDGPNKGTLKLIYKKDGYEVLLNPESGEFLHDLLNAK